jgi:hypothetical protein
VERRKKGRKGIGRYTKIIQKIHMKMNGIVDAKLELMLEHAAITLAEKANDRQK